MANWTFTNGRPNFDWQTTLADLISNGVFTTVGAGLPSVILESGTYQLVITSATSDIETSDADTIIAGTGLTFEMFDGATSIFSLSSFTDPRDYTDVQTVLDDGGTNIQQIFALLAPESMTIVGSGDSEALFGGSSADTISGNAGDDTITGGDGADSIDGGADTDTLDYSGEGGLGAISVDLSAQTVTDTFGATDTVTNIEIVIGTSQDDSFTGDALANRFEGGNGADGFNGSAGSDTFVGGLGDNYVGYGSIGHGIDINFETGIVDKGVDGTDTLFDIVSGHATDFDDTVTMNNGGGYIFGGGGADSLLGGNGNDNFLAGSGADTIDGGGGNNNVDYFDDNFDIAGPSIHGVIVNLSGTAITFDVGTGNQTVQGGHAYDNWGGIDELHNVQNVGGSFFGDAIVGGDEDNGINGNSGDDTLIGGMGNDFIEGGNGSDDMRGDRPTGAVAMPTTTTMATRTTISTTPCRIKTKTAEPASRSM